MESILTYIGSIASVLGIPLAIYLYLRSREEKVDKIRRDILQIISYQIGENRRLNIFEIEKVINSNIRNNKLANRSITVVNIIEDLISDTISSPLLNSDSKNKILENLKEIFPDSKQKIEGTGTQSSPATTFAVVTVMISLIPMLLVLVVGKEGWSERAEWWLTFNAVEGYLPNVIFSIVAAMLGLSLSFAISKIKKEHNRSSNTNADNGAGS